jgi:outer membrane protein, multidrug efflux system
MKLAIVVFALVQLLATCSAPVYQRPDASLPSVYRGAEQSNTTIPPMGALGWWEIFKDPDLQALIRTAVTRNFDTRIAAERVLQAQAQLTIVSGNRYPQLNAVASGQYTKVNGPEAPNIPREEWLPNLLLTLQYEVDLFGKVRSQTAAAQAQVLQSEFARETVLATTVSSVVTLYFELRELDLELSITREVLKARTESLRIVQQRYRAGRGNLQEVSQAQELVAEASASIPVIQREAATRENALSILLGNYPGAIARGLPLQQQIVLPNDPSAGMPSALLEQRPDIRASEENLVAANAQVGVARALLFPQFTIGASVGVGTAQIDGVNYPEGLISILPQIVQQVFNAGAAHANVAKSQSAKEQAILEYVQSIHQAVADVSDALIAYEKDRKYVAERAATSAAATTSLQTADIRFINGRTPYLDVLVSDSRSYYAQIAQAHAELGERLALVQLYRATGGGWQVEPAPQPSSLSPPP